MIRTQIQLPEQKYDKLRQIAAIQHRSMADCIREGIDAFLQRTAVEEEGLATIAGRFTPLPPGELKDHDRWWAEAAVPQTGGRSGT
ncbi:MAG: hypothetical protein A3K18_32925 [Lentisphaerae bacterium RIFOXYA12_64_32]|nr:MAG: hypothetical protein A3K18_32925 [Lentisphaerae bacterium RIFOXYA12_64_32]